jgi:SAM-dependent methyltransferase
MGSAIRFTGTGPGVHTQDGCAVELYRRLPADGEAEIVATVVPAGGSILELGSGPGRVTHALVARGYAVTAVDNSAEMLAHIRGAETVQADIEDLDLGRSFDAVLLASTLINFPEPRTRTALLATCRRHVRPGGAVLIERRNPDTFVDPGRSGRRGGRHPPHRRIGPARGPLGPYRLALRSSRRGVDAKLHLRADRRCTDDGGAGHRRAAAGALA